MPLLWVQGVTDVRGGKIYYLFIEDAFVYIHAYNDFDLITLFMENEDLYALINGDMWFLELSIKCWNFRARFVSQEIFSLLEEKCMVDQEKIDDDVPDLIEAEVVEDSEDEYSGQSWIYDGYEIPVSPISEHMMGSFSKYSLSPLTEAKISYDEKGKLLNSIAEVKMGDNVAISILDLTSDEAKTSVVPLKNAKMSFKSFLVYWMRRTFPFCKSWKGYQILYAFCEGCAYNGNRDKILVDGIRVREYSAEGANFKGLLEDWISLWWLVLYREQKDDFDNSDWLFLNNCVENFSNYYSMDTYCFSYDMNLGKAKCCSIEVCDDISEALNRKEVTGFRRLLLQKCRLVILKASSDVSHELMRNASFSGMKFGHILLTRQARRDMDFWSKIQKEIPSKKEKWKMWMFLKGVLESYEELWTRLKDKNGICVFDCGLEEVNRFEN